MIKEVGMGRNFSQPDIRPLMGYLAAILGSRCYQSPFDVLEFVASTLNKENKAGYTAQDAPSRRLKIAGDGRTDQRTDGHTLL